MSRAPFGSAAPLDAELDDLRARAAQAEARAAQAEARAAEERAGRERAEQDKARMAEQVARLGEELTGIVGHDLRNPLGSVLISAKILQRRGPPEQQANLARLASSAERLARMIDQLLDLTRVRVGGGLVLASAEMDLGEAVADVVARLRDAHPGRTITVSCAAGLRGRWDPDRLAALIGTLIANAAEHGAPDAPVTVTAQTDDQGGARLAVHSGGVIPPERLGDLFAPFARKHGASAGRRGLGLGLFLAHETARAHGGTLQVRSSEEAGTVFELALPG